ncbi:DUF7619 domain-containing protein [Flavobacterium wongokense]|uniref:DUF7619 domain-containing protein n=1 Tax=Flavobacterium wongokense TaxID=2910674 RepID=UPI001F406B87|nr:T9SS type A sorting domain-containing protein [Flavobacterium sp. WG47]MCF6131090.1 T9SS type A sorting domain-containing protein [Flavobacterium sp. WG47]
MKKFLFLSLILFLGVSNVHSQACGDVFTDPGGPNANFANNTDYTVTICPSNPGDVVTVTFTSFGMEMNYDGLYVFNGNSITAPQIASTNVAGNVPGGLAGWYSGSTIPGPFTSTSPDGCLTFRFRSDNSVTGPGWIANVTCAPRPSCTIPTNLTVNSITHNSANFNWVQAANPDSSVANTWECIVLPAGSPAPTAGSTGYVVATANPFVITGLSALTCYTCYVRAVCSLSDNSDWSTGVNFCTLMAPAECGTQFTDNGGPSANYSFSNGGTDSITTICPTNPGDTVTVLFNSFSTEATWDALYVFDGNSIAAAQIPSSNPAGNVPGGLAGGFWGNVTPGPFTSSSPDGCLTFRFRMDGSVTYPGWVADVICTPNPGKVILVAFVDANNNGVKETSELLFPNGNFIYQQNNNGTNINGYSPSGQYVLYDNNTSNTYDFSYQLQSQFAPYYDSGTTTFNDISVGTTTQILYFPVLLTQTYNDVSISLAPYVAPRPGYTYLNQIRYKNRGIATTNGSITFTKPPQINTFTVYPQTGIVMNPTGFTYNFTNLLPNETRILNVTMDVPLVPIVNANDLLTDSVTISAPANDIDLTNNSSSNSQIVVNSLDPNDKMESRGKTIPFDSFAPDDYFFYTIRFQNNGTANAIDVRIEDLLNAQIDETTVQMVASSHEYTMKRINNQLVWDFKNIFLNMASVNEAGSRGYVQFKVKLKPGFQAGDIIPNNAFIYFDSNPAIVTATFNSKFIVPLSVADFDSDSLVLYPNPATNLVQVDMVNTNEQLKRVVFYDLLGKAVKTVSTIATQSLGIDVSDLSKGVYLVEIVSESNLKLTKKLIIQ